MALKISGLPSRGSDIQYIVGQADLNENGYIDTSREASLALKYLTEAGVANDYPNTVQILREMASYYTNSHSQQREPLDDYEKKHFTRHDYGQLWNKPEKTNLANYYYLDQMSPRGKRYIIHHLSRKGYGNREKLSNDDRYLQSRYRSYKKANNINTNSRVFDRATFDSMNSGNDR